MNMKNLISSGFFEGLKNISLVITTFGLVFGLLYKFSNKMRDWLKSKVRNWTGSKENEDRDLKLEESIGEIKDCISVLSDKMTEILDQQDCIIHCNQDLLRSQINYLYFKYLPVKKLPIFEKENLIKMYASYKRLGGNSYIDHLYTELMSWEPFQKEINVKH